MTSKCLKSHGLGLFMLIKCSLVLRMAYLTWPCTDMESTGTHLHRVTNGYTGAVERKVLACIWFGRVFSYLTTCGHMRPHLE